MSTSTAAATAFPVLEMQAGTAGLAVVAHLDRATLGAHTGFAGVTNIVTMHTLSATDSSRVRIASRTVMVNLPSPSTNSPAHLSVCCQ
ncbi:hypothetical protein AFA91_25705 [Mycolicibacterium goodii]|uniref:Uncharacterized protein n=1 Tax=Mycolicibacterium goodii TaxID=134601 RepID=A0A0K0XBC8_MYCGD|nr:hypothetical protein AFA91_25705 [Mycolicibacterium goodii]